MVADVPAATPPSVNSILRAPPGYALPVGARHFVPRSVVRGFRCLGVLGGGKSRVESRGGLLEGGQG